jgi:trk system potassium uptake protein TrkA
MSHLNKRLKEIGSEELRKNYRVVAISKGDRTIIPTGEDYINRNDQLFVMTKQENLPGLLSLTGKEDQKLERLLSSVEGRSAAEWLQGSSKADGM